MGTLFLIGFRSLFQHRTRTFLLGAAIAAVTMLLILLSGLSVGMRHTMLETATTLMTGHVNVAGFYKVTSGQSAPVVTDYQKVIDIARREVGSELDYISQRGRGWAKLISETGSMQVGVGGIDVAKEPGIRRVLVLKDGSFEGLNKPDGILIFAEQAKKLEAKVGDRLTIAAPTARGTNNTIDVTVVAIANDVGLLSSWNTFVNIQGLRALYQLNDKTTGAIHLYLKDFTRAQAVQAHLRKVFEKEGYGVMENDPRAFWMKFEVVNRENWTGQKLDVTNWEDEISFMKWTVDALTLLSVFLTTVLIVIIGVGVMNIMWITIRERTREIGTLRAIGMQRASVLQMFVIEGFLLGLFGTVAGTTLGLLASFAANAAHIALPVAAQLFVMTDHLILTPTVGWAAFGIVFITSILTGISIIPSLRAARMKPISAMSHFG
jgi:putative ABC transport system permease protein